MVGTGPAGVLDTGNQVSAFQMTVLNLLKSEVAIELGYLDAS